MKKIFITGISGFVGSWLVDFLLENEPEIEIHGLVRWRSPIDNIRDYLDKIHLHYGDLLDLSSLIKIFEEVKPDSVVHLAAQSYVLCSFDMPVATLETNGIGSCNLLEAIKLLNKKIGYNPAVLLISSSEVYGQVKENEIPITEDQPLRPASPYAVSKVCEDMLGYQYWLSYGLRIIRTRMFSHEGPRRGFVFVLSNFAKQIAAIEAYKQEPTIYVGNLDSVRTFADVRDTVKAYWIALNKCKPGEVYNIGGDRTMTIREMLNMLLKLSVRSDIDIKQDPGRLRPSDVTLQIPCCDKFKKETGWEPEIPFEETVEDTLNYWREYYRKFSA